MYNVGSILRKMFGSSIGINQKVIRNTWSFADPLVYNIFDHCHHISRNHKVPVVSDGFPRNINQLDYMDKRLRVAEYGNVKIVMHLLDVSEKEQLKRVLERNGELTEYHVERIAESRRDFENLIERMEGILVNDTENIDYELIWYKQEHGTFWSVSTNAREYK